LRNMAVCCFLCRGSPNGATLGCTQCVHFAVHFQLPLISFTPKLRTPMYLTGLSDKSLSIAPMVSPMAWETLDQWSKYRSSPFRSLGLCLQDFIDH
jgi:hypothetical protein